MAKPLPTDVQQITVRKPDWGNDSGVESCDKIKATWLGHACFLVEFPHCQKSSPELEARGIHILFDPVFSDRCSPSQYIGPKRYTRKSSIIYESLKFVNGHC